MRTAVVVIVFILLAPSLVLARQSYPASTYKVNEKPRLAILKPVCLEGKKDAHIPEEAEEAMKFDLNFSGCVWVMTGLPRENTDGIRPGEFDFVPWRTAGAALLLKTGYATEGDRVMIEFRLYDVPAGKQVWSEVFAGKRRFVRKMAHAFADEILRVVAGQEGPFTGQISFASTRTGNKEVFIMDYDGHNVRQVTSNGSINLNPSFSPDGRKMIYTSYKMGNPDLYLRKIVGGSETRISARTGLNVTAAWAPRGDRIALAMSKDGNSQIYLINKNGKELARLTRDNAIDISPSWSPDGTHIAFVSDREGTPQIYIMKADGSEVRRVTRKGDYNVGPSWSPRGDRILYCRRQVKGPGFQVFAINADGTGDIQLTTEGRNEYPHWSPDGRFITFTSTREGNKAIYIMRADGSSQVKVSRGKGEDSQPVWSTRP